MRKSKKHYVKSISKPPLTVILTVILAFINPARVCVKSAIKPAQTPDTAPSQIKKPTAAPEKITSSPASAPQSASNAERILAGMTLKEKISQLFIVLPESFCGFDRGKADKLTPDAETFFEEYPSGGIILSLNNITSPKQLKRLTDDFQRLSKLPLFIGIDEEGGEIVRIARCKKFGVKTFPPMSEIGRTGDPERAYEAGFTIGGYLREYGVNLNFAPVADVFTNPQNAVIGRRSFGNDPHIVSSMIEAEIKGFHDRGIMTCAKHFPGHGDTKDDTHFGFVKIEKTWAELLKCELIPFYGAIEASCDMLMAAHIAAPAVTDNNLPATLSHTLITEKLRNEMGFSGVVITDAMVMKAITDLYSSGEAAIKAIKAGVDIILMPEDYEAAFMGLYEAVKCGEISETRIDESVLRILKLKEKYISPENFDWDNYGK